MTNINSDNYLNDKDKEKNKKIYEQEPGVGIFERNKKVGGRKNLQRV